jgi:hypothetical protein
MANFDVQGARKAGYTDEEIARHLASESNFDFEGASQAGYSAGDIIKHLTSEAPEQPKEVSTQQEARALPSFIWDRLSPYGKEAYRRTFTPSYALGEPSSGFTAGLEDLPLGAAQLGANVFSLLQSGEPATEANRAMREREAQIEQSRALAGREGFDWARLGGGIASPTNIPVERGLRLLSSAEGGLVDTLRRTAGTGASVSALQPVAGEEFWKDKGTQAAVGAVLGPVAQTGVNAVVKLGSILTPTTKAGRQKAMAEALDSMLGPDKEEAIKALQNAKEFVTGSRPTVAEVLADLPGAVELVVKQAKLSQQPGLRSQFEKRTTENQAARVRELEKISGTEAQRQRVATVRDQRTGQLREQALGQADEARLTLGVIDRQSNEEAARLIRQNRQLFPESIDVDERFADVLPTSPAELTKQIRARASALKSTQLQMLEQNGTFPIYAKDLIADINQRIELEGTDVGKAALRGIRDKIASKADENGILSSHDLYNNVRKTINQDIASLLSSGQQFASGGLDQQAAKAAGDIKKAIDASLNKTSSGLWSKYLTSYQQYSKKLDRMEVGKHLLDKLRQPGVEADSVGLRPDRVGAFAGAIENATATVSKATGKPRYAVGEEGLRQVLTPRETQAVGNILKDLSREQAALTKGRRGAAQEAGVQDVSRFIPPWLSAGVSVVKQALSAARDKSNSKFNKELSALMLEPQQMAQFLSSMSSDQASIVGRLFYDMATPQNKTMLINLFTVPEPARAVGRPEEF